MNLLSAKLEATLRIKINNKPWKSILLKWFDISRQTFIYHVLAKLFLFDYKLPFIIDKLGTWGLDMDNYFFLQMYTSIIFSPCYQPLLILAQLWQHFICNYTQIYGEFMLIGATIKYNNFNYLFTMFYNVYNIFT